MSDEPLDVRERHDLAMRVFQGACAAFPKSAVRWLLPSDFVEAGEVEVVEARFIAQDRNQKLYAVPDPPQANNATSVLASLGRVAAEELAKAAIEGEQGAGELSVKVEPLNWAELERQTLAKGGGPLEFWLRLRYGGNSLGTALFGVLMPEFGSDGRETHWDMVGHLSWQLLVARRFAQTRDGKSKIHVLLGKVLYLGYGDGLHDAEEDCSVIRRTDRQDPLNKLRGALDTPEGQGETRGANQQRLRDMRKKHDARCAAAARRQQLMGDAMISQAELDALMPNIDVEHDFITMRHPYSALRLWELPFADVAKMMPAECIALALFSYVGSQTMASALEQCAFTLHSRGGPLSDDEHREALRLLGQAARIWLPTNTVEATLRPFHR